MRERGWGEGFVPPLKGSISILSFVLRTNVRYNKQYDHTIIA